MGKELSSKVKFLKIILIILNVVFIIFGLALLGLGIYFKIENKLSLTLHELTNVSTFKEYDLDFVVFALLGGGILTLFISLGGCLGIVRESPRLLYTYTIVFSILIVVEIVGLIIVLIYQYKLVTIYKTNLEQVFTEALQNNQTNVLNIFHELEKSDKCCAINGASDYTKAGKTAPSWCSQFKDGCSDVIIKFLKRKLLIINATLGIVSVLESFGLVGAMLLAVAFKRASDVINSSNPKESIVKIVPGRRRNYIQLR